MQRSSSARDADSAGGDFAGPWQQPGKRTRAQSSSEAEAAPGAARSGRANHGDARERPTDSGDRMGDWQPTSLLGAMGLDDAPAAPEALAGNPADRTDAAGNARTTHRSPTLADSPDAPAGIAPAVAPGAANVKVLAPPARPLHFDAPASPDVSLLYEVGAEGSPPPAGFTTITNRLGSVEAPLLQQSASPAIFIANQPAAADVDQGGIGDCYLMSALSNMAARDPGHIKSMMKPDGKGGATVTLWRRQEHAKTLIERIMGPFGNAPKYDYTPVHITVSDELAFNLSNGKVHGAALRAAPQPSSVDYWADVSGDLLGVHRKEVYECARWVPLLEKAYARFCQSHDQYGGSAPAGEANPVAAPGASGYEGLVGGFSYLTLRVLYGPAADAEGALQYEKMTAFAPAGGNILAANPQVVDQLLLLAGRKDTAQPADTTAPILTANTAPTAQLNNLITAITAAMADPDYANLSADTQTKLAALNATLVAWQAIPPDPAGAPGPKAAARSAVGNAAVEVARTPNHGDLAELRGAMPTPIQFAASSDAVPAADAPRLERFGRRLQRASTSSLCPFVVTVVGRASSDGDEAQNQAISERRAANTHAAILDGRDAAKMARHTYDVRGVGPTGAAPTAAWRRVDLAVEADRPDNELFAGARSTALRNMMDLVLNVRNLGTDSSVGQRNVYANHAYSVVGVSFVDFAKLAMPLQAVPAASRPFLYPLIDCDSSTVRLRNPHHGNEPDRTGMGQPTRAGDGAPSGASSDGVFTMSINEFFLNFNSVDSGVLPKTPDP